MTRRSVALRKDDTFSVFDAVVSMPAGAADACLFERGSDAESPFFSLSTSDRLRFLEDDDDDDGGCFELSTDDVLGFDLGDAGGEGKLSSMTTSLDKVAIRAMRSCSCDCVRYLWRTDWVRVCVSKGATYKQTVTRTWAFLRWPVGLEGSKSRSP